ncbi:hypothetical protein PAMC26510_14870 [Caballeronia sordidicola]|uniref:Uncharacterized protein n=1 Tax=Caballeronia sordidicola TaxID=196367 RepID=A0A242N4W6_CABSO|nr:hypothetical protein PAMC26510_14870 [Caballeronia sordidicola]OTP78701.1 hypothetical protein PAMC26577_03680 [Caballeronia sordidicola]
MNLRSSQYKLEYFVHERSDQNYRTFACESRTSQLPGF